MNPMLSLSFAHPTPMAKGAESVAHQAGLALDNTENKSDKNNTDAADTFGQLLNQSGQQQQVVTRQSFADFNASFKIKHTSTLDEKQLGRPDIVLPPVLPPDEKLSAAAAGVIATIAVVDSNAVDDANVDGNSHNNSHDNTHSTDEAIADHNNNATILLGLLDKASQTRQQLAAQSDKNIQLVGEEVNVGKVSSVKPEWFTLPIYPNISNAGAEPAAASDKSPVSSLAATALLNQQQVVAKNNGADAVAKSTDELGVKPEEPGVNTLTKGVEAASANASAVDKTLDQQSAVTVQGSKVAHEQALTVAVNTDSDADSQQQPAGNTTTAVLEKPALASDLTAEKANKKSLAVANQPAPATTIFADAGPRVSAQAPTETAQATVLNSAAIAADSAMAKQQRAGADSTAQISQALAANSDATDGTAKVESVITGAGPRADTSLSGFANAFSPASQQQTETVAARLEGVTIAVAQQATDRSKAEGVTKTVTEQLKQINLLEQNAAGQLKERINLMINQKIQVAEIRLDPAELGQMQIRVNLQQEQATVQFIVQQQHAKELLEQQMPRLREMLQQQGIQLGEGQVQHQRQGDSNASGQRNGNSGSGQGLGQQHGDEKATAVQLDVKLSERLVDYYA
jgi:flagellar hook-length control protein FliK